MTLDVRGLSFRYFDSAADGQPQVEASGQENNDVESRVHWTVTARSEASKV